MLGVTQCMLDMHACSMHAASMHNASGCEPSATYAALCSQPCNGWCFGEAGDAIPWLPHCGSDQRPLTDAHACVHGACVRCVCVGVCVCVSDVCVCQMYVRQMYVHRSDVYVSDVCALDVCASDVCVLDMHVCVSDVSCVCQC